MIDWFRVSWGRRWPFPTDDGDGASGDGDGDDEDGGVVRGRVDMTSANSVVAMSRTRTHVTANSTPPPLFLTPFSLNLLGI